MRRVVATAAAALVALFSAQALAAAPVVTDISEPTEGAAPLNPEDVHMVAVFDDADGNDHVCSDWEIWTTEPAEPAWEAHCASGGEGVHIHLGDGEFVESPAGRVGLMHEMEYELRVRFLDSSDEWSEWATRVFTTRPPGPPGNEATTWTAREDYVVETFAEDLQLPVNIAMVPDPGPHAGDPFMYVTELYGTVKVITRDGTVKDYETDLLNFNPTGNFPGSGEMGVTGILVEPVTGDVLVSLVYENEASLQDPKPHYPKVIRLHSDERGLAAVGEPTTILDMFGEPQGASHQVSNLTIGPDGYLYVHNGDGFDPSTARDIDSFRGKVLRMTLDGDPVSSNPFYVSGDGISARDYVFALGLRNPFGGAWRLSDGSHYFVENGPQVDRLARVIRGADYLWAGEDATMAHLASYSWFPAHAPVNIEFVEPARFGGSGFPAVSMGHAFVTESAATWATGPLETGKRIVEFGLDSTGKLTSGPDMLVEYTGVGKATAVGLAAGPDGLYFTDLYKDTGFTSPIDRGANVLRVRCTGTCPLGKEDDVPPEVDAALALGVRHFRLQRRVFSVARGKGGRASSVARRGTTFRYSLSRRASIRLQIRPLSRGWFVRGKCRRSPKRVKGRVHFSRRCALRSPRGVLLGPGRGGPNRRRFAGRLRARPLPPGRYRATIRARDAEGNVARPRMADFRVVASR